MPDNVQLPVTGTGTADVVVATDQDPTVLDHYQRIKETDPAEGSYVPLASITRALDAIPQVEDTALRRTLEEVRLLLEEFLVVATDNEPPKRLDPATSVFAAKHVTVTNAPTQIFPSNQGRRRLTIANYQTVTVYIQSGAHVATNNGIRLDTGTSITLQVRGEVWGITTSSYSPTGEDDRLHAWEEYS